MKKRLLGLALSVASLAANAAAPADPWTLVPALPTACYDEQDDFDEILTARIETISAEISRQEQLNGQIEDRLEALDPQEWMRRIMDYMMENAEEATKAMQVMQSLGSETTVESIQKEEAGEGEQTQALTALFARQDAALKTATDPIFAKRNKIIAIGADPEFEVLSRQLDQEYVQLCPSAASYRSTIKMEAVKKYLMRIAEIYARREDKRFWD